MPYLSASLDAPKFSTTYRTLPVYFAATSSTSKLAGSERFQVKGQRTSVRSMVLPPARLATAVACSAAVYAGATLSTMEAACRQLSGDGLAAEGKADARSRKRASTESSRFDAA